MARSRDWVTRDVRDALVARAGSRYLGVVSVLTAATAVGYIGLLGQQGDWPGIDARQTLVLALLAGFAIVSAIGTVARSIFVRAATSAACAGGLLPFGLLALFSIGLPLMVAGAVALVAWLGVSTAAPGRDSLLVSAASAIAAIVILAVGLALVG